MEEDSELKLLMAKKMAAMRRKIELSEEAKKEKSSRQLLEQMLTDRGDEVLGTAYSFFPKETQIIVDELARLIKDGKIDGKITGGELYGVFRNVGLRFSLNTSIKVEEKGKFVDLADKLKAKKENGE